MNVRNVLIGALAAQVGLVLLTWWPRGADAPEVLELVPSGGNGITELTVLGKGDGKQPVTLRSVDGTWKVASAHDYPADPDKVAEVVTALGELRLRQPIATQAASHESLGVTDDGFERKLTFTADGTPRTVLVGAAASKAIHLRLEGTDAVYKVKGVSAWTLKDDAKSYLPTNHVDVDPAGLVRFELTNATGTLTLAKVDGAWTMEAPVAGPVDATAVDALLEKALKVRLAEVVGPDVLPEHGLTEGATRVTWSTSVDGASVDGGYVVGAEVDGKFFVRSDDLPFVVRAPTYRLKDLVALDPAGLVPAPVGAEVPPE